MRSDAGRRASFFAAAALAALTAAACASAGAGPSEPDRGPTSAARGPEAPAAARAVLGRLDSLSVSGNHDAAVRVADSAYFRWRKRPDLRPAAGWALWWEARALESQGRRRAAASRIEELLALGPPADLLRRSLGRLLELRLELGEAPSALSWLADRPAELEGELAQRARAAAARLSIGELRTLVQQADGRPAAASLFRAELARAWARAGWTDSARAAARAVLSGQPRSADRETARRVLEGGVPAGSPPRVGVVLPLSGRLATAGEVIRRGVLLAAGDSSAREFELVIRDDSSDAGRARALVRELERAGVTAVVGPVSTEAFRAAAEARDDPGLPLVSPTAAELSRSVPNVYTLRDRRQRVRDVARALGEWFSVGGGLTKLAVLRPASPWGREYELAFRGALRRGGGWISAVGRYIPDSTTFAGPVSWLASSDPQGVFVAADDPRTVLQMAPQLSFYGLRSALVGGSAAWGDPYAVRRLAGSFPEYWVAPAFVDRQDSTSAWAEFRSRYEREYRRSVPGNELPALAYDALRWVRASLNPHGLVRPSVVARSLKGGDPHRGATGTFVAVPRRSTVRRRPEVRMAHGGRLSPPDTSVLQRWRRDAERLEAAGQRRRRARARSQVRAWKKRHAEEDEEGEGEPGAPPGDTSRAGDYGNRETGGTSNR